jgi:hypothetical protein
MSVPMILKSLGQHTNTEYTFENRMRNAHAEVSNVDCRACCSTSVKKREGKKSHSTIVRRKSAPERFVNYVAQD